MAGTLGLFKNILDIGPNAGPTETDNTEIKEPTNILTSGGSLKWF
ncbi:MAG: hypothetical protein AAFV69_12965 [Pseudomonadota bacterium]